MWDQNFGTVKEAVSVRMSVRHWNANNRDTAVFSRNPGYKYFQFGEISHWFIIRLLCHSNNCVSFLFLGLSPHGGKVAAKSLSHLQKNTFKTRKKYFSLSYLASEIS